MMVRMSQVRMGEAGTVAGAGLELQAGGSNYSIYRPAALKVLRMTRRPMAAGEIVKCAALLLPVLPAVLPFLACLACSVPIHAHMNCILVPSTAGQPFRVYASVFHSAF